MWIIIFTRKKLEILLSLVSSLRMAETYYIDYLQEHLEDQAHTDCCVYCKLVTTKINGSLQGHLSGCTYRFCSYCLITK